MKCERRREPCYLKQQQNPVGKFCVVLCAFAIFGRKTSSVCYTSFRVNLDHWSLLAKNRDLS